MTYQYKSEVKAFDFWKLTMYQTYRSVAGMCNLVFTVAMILLAVKFWNRAGDLMQVLMLLGCLLFPVIQPIGIYAKAKAQVAAAPKDVELRFDDEGLFVTVGKQQEQLRWNQIRVVKQRGMLIVLSGARHGYMLSNRILGKERDAFLTFAEARAGK